jgi:hypothetical protein
MKRFTVLFVLLAAFSSAAFAQTAPVENLIDNFDEITEPSAWTFSNGPEFPGAAGRFERVADPDDPANHVGRLTFDFTGGGRYVGATCSLQGAPESAAVRVRVFKPDFMRLTIRVTDATGQTLQKELPAPPGRWFDAMATLSEFEGHWHGKNDGIVHGAPVMVHILGEYRGVMSPAVGSVLIDDLRLIPGKPGSMTDTEENEFLAIDFARGGPWRLRHDSKPGESRVDGNIFQYDFTQGAHWLTFEVNRTLIAKPRSIRLRVRGNSGGHPLKVTVRSHFQALDAWVGPPTNDGIHEFSLPLPPEGKWVTQKGTHDEELKLPLRLGEIVLEGVNQRNAGSLEMLDLRVTGAYHRRRACLMLAESRQSADGRTEFVVRAQNIGKTPVEGVIRWTLRDFAEEALASGELPAHLPAGGEIVEMSVPMPAGIDRPFVEARFDLDAGEQVATPALAYAVKPIEKPSGDATLDSASPFGMGVYLYRYHWHPSGFDGMRRAAALARDAGVKWSREQFDWSGIEPARGKFDFSFHDRMVDVAHEHGMHVYGLLCYWTPWTKPYTKEGIEDFARYAEETARHYKDRIQHWEVWNEPNIFFWAGPKELYAELLARTYDAVKRGNPDATVIGVSTAHVDLEFVEKAMKLGGKFDAVSVHPYRPTLDDAAYIAELKAAEKLTGKPVWISEIGWPVHRAGDEHSIDPYYTTTPRQQAGLIVRSYIGALAAGVKNITWYNFRDDGNDLFFNEQNFGILTEDLRPKPAYRAYATMARMLSGKTFKEQSEPAKGVVAMRFESADDANDAVTVIWSLHEDLSVDLPELTGTSVTNLMGESQDLSPDGGKVRVELMRGMPVFVARK